jgi:hypothetical protein
LGRATAKTQRDQEYCIEHDLRYRIENVLGLRLA